MKTVKWTGFVIDVEATGPIPGDYSMIEIGIVKLDKKLSKTFYSKLEPLDHAGFDPGALKSIGADIDTVKRYREDPKKVMMSAESFIMKNTMQGTFPVFFSDNNGFDWMFSHWYFVHFLERDPFGHTSRNIADLYRGQQCHFKANFKKLRETKHTHNPVDDAKGNAEALIKIVDLGLEGLIIE